MNTRTLGGRCRWWRVEGAERRGVGNRADVGEDLDQPAPRDLATGDAYTIADMAIFPWIARLELEAPRPATLRAYARGAAINTTPTVTRESKAILLNRAA